MGAGVTIGILRYWSGVDSVPYKCACGLSDSCVDTSYGCNCDKNDDVLREAELLVMQLRFGDTSGSKEKGYHTLGWLKCYGVI